jgi:tetratricopeptide (TPR) repeat protein
MAGRKLTTVLIVLLSAGALLAAEDSPAKTSTPPGFRRTPPETSAKVRLSVVSVVNDEDNHALSQATGFFVAPGRVLTSRHSLANAGRGELRLSSGKHVPIAGIVAEDKRLNLAMISAGINANDGHTLQLASSDPREGAPVNMVGTESQPPRAASEFEQALRINPTQTGTQYDLGVAYEEMGMLQEAIDAYRKALSLSPDTEQIYYNLGVTYGKLGRWREAVHAFEETIRIAPGSADAHYNLGLAHLALCQTSQALQEQRDLSGLDKERADKLFHLIKRLGCAAARNRVIPRAATAERNAR